MKKFTSCEKQKTAMQIIDYLKKNGSFYCIRIFTDNKCYTSYPVDTWTQKYSHEKTKNGTEYWVYEDILPQTYSRYINNDTITIMFDGDPMYDDTNYGEMYYIDNINELLKKYNLYLELGNAWNASAWER